MALSCQMCKAIKLPRLVNTIPFEKFNWIFLNLSTIDILGWVILCCGELFCALLKHLATPLDSTD